MTAEGRRSLRVLFKAGLLISLPVTGYLWAQTGASTLAIAMTVVCGVMALGAELLASLAEADLATLRTVADAEDSNFEIQVTGKDEKIRQMDRIVETLSNQNHDLRGKLVSIHGEVHRINEETEHAAAAAEAAGGEPSAEEPSEEPGGEVTDINSLRSRR